MSVSLIADRIGGNEKQPRSSIAIVTVVGVVLAVVAVTIVVTTRVTIRSRRENKKKGGYLEQNFIEVFRYAMEKKIGKCLE